MAIISWSGTITSVDFHYKSTYSITILSNLFPLYNNLADPTSLGGDAIAASAATVTIQGLFTIPICLYSLSVFLYVHGYRFLACYVQSVVVTFLYL